MPAMDAMLCWRCGYWTKEGDRFRLRMSVNIFAEAKPGSKTDHVRCKHGRIGHKCMR
jgi:hypothetical protein